MSRAKAGSNEALLRVTAPELIGPVLSRVVAMLVARAECPIDTLDDALLLCDAIAAHAPEFTGGETVVTISTAPGGLSLRVGPLDKQGGRAFVNASELPDVGNVIERVADAVEQDGDTLLLALRYDS